MAAFDITPTGPVRVGVAAGTDVRVDGADEFVRIRAHDLSDAARRAASARYDRPGVDVLVDIEVVIARDARTARKTMSEADGRGGGDTLSYVGTPTGLVGLINDIHGLGIADGAVLIPLADSGVLALLRHQVLPELRGPRGDVRQLRPA